MPDQTLLVDVSLPAGVSPVQAATTTTKPSPTSAYAEAANASHSYASSGVSSQAYGTASSDRPYVQSESGPGYSSSGLNPPTSDQPSNMDVMRWAAAANA